MGKVEYAHVTYDLTLNVAQLLAKLNPGMTLCYVTGAGTDSSEQGRVAWARVKGATENALIRLFKRVYMFRPALKAQIVATLAALESVEAAEVDSFVGRDVRFAFGERHVDFTAENFLLSFSQPNFYFHAATTYDILRWKGVPIGKRDFMGRTRKKS
jgi:hypothetical protein